MVNSKERDYRTATAAELERDADRARRAKQALENHKRPGRTADAKLRDALDHVRNSEIKNPGRQAGADVALTGCKTTECRCCDES